MNIRHPANVRIGAVTTESWPNPLTTELSFPNVGSLVVQEDAVRVTKPPRKIARAGRDFVNAIFFVVETESPYEGSGGGVIAWDLSIHRIQGDTLIGGPVGYLLQNGRYIREPNHSPDWVAVNRQDVVRAWRGGGQEIGNLFAPIPVAFPSPPPAPVPVKPIKTSQGAPYVPSGLANGRLNARLADTFRNQLRLAQQRGDAARIKRISDILTSNGAALA